MKNYTHQKRPYRAVAAQWDGKNTKDIIALFHDARLHDENHLMVRYGNGISTVTRGSWVVIGENGAIKCYSDDVFNVKYQQLKE